MGKEKKKIITRKRCLCVYARISSAFMIVFTLLRIVGRTNRENKFHERLHKMQKLKERLEKKKIGENIFSKHRDDFIHVLNGCYLLLLFSYSPRTEKGEN